MTKWGLRHHFRDWHPLDKVSMLCEGAYPKYVLCGMQTNRRQIGQGHKGTKLCRDSVAKRHQMCLRTDVALALR